MTSNNYQVDAALTGTQLGRSDHVLWGGAVGAGIEYGFAPNWSVGVEYDHLFMQPSTATFTTVPGGVTTDRIRQDVDLVTARINYKFGGPVFLRY
ncbi:outer membrane immunogenic protein [Bradyrhizobium sp. Rc3b]|nr:outer membrane immunogenic protein [Bradyrhizobium sp. Rc3b]